MAIAVGIVFLGAVLFSAKAVLVKLSLPLGIEAVPLLTLRMLFALPCYAVVLIFVEVNRVRAKASLEAKPTSNASGFGDWVSVIGLGVVGYYLASYFDFWGLEHISASLERVILYCYPTLVLIISATFLGRRIRLSQVVAISLCYLGILIAVGYGPATESNANSVLGIVLVFLSALTYAIFLVGSGELIPRMGVWRFTCWAMLTSTFCIVVHYSVTYPFTNLFEYPRQVYIYAAVMAIFSTVLPSFLISEGIKRIGASNAAIIGGIGPVSTIVLASIFLGETFTLPQILGTLLVIAGVVYISVKGKADDSV